MTTRFAGTAGTGRLLLCGAAALAIIAPFAAQAQSKAIAGDASPQADAAKDKQPENGQLQSGNSIIVTATKQAKTLQDTPVAVSVTSKEVIERDHIEDLNDLQQVVPSLQVGQRQSLASTNFFIRGFGNGANNAGIEPSVGVFVDGVYRARSASQITDLPNVERIEVLRGPQSTLFGKNASAGVISITTQEPQFIWQGSAQLTYGNYNDWLGKAYVTGPLSDKWAVSLAGDFNSRDGFFRDLGTGGRSNNRNRWFLRGQALYDNGSNLKVRLIADYNNINEHCCAVINAQSGPATAAILALGGKVTDPNNPFADVIYYNYPSTNLIKNWGFSGEVDYDIGNFTLTSITAKRITRADTAQDSDFSSADLIYPNAQQLDVATFTQEFRLSGQVTDRLNLLLGAFYLHENINQYNQLLYGTQFRPYANILIQQASGGALDVPTLEAALGQADGTNYSGQFFADGQGFHEHYTLKSDSISIYGQFDYKVTPKLTLTLGGNYTDDRKRYTANAVSSDVFSAINLDAPQYAPFRAQLLTQGYLANAVGQALNLGQNATASQIQQFAASNAAAFSQILGMAQQYATANANNPSANPLAPLRALQFLPPFLDVPNAVEPGRVNDNNFSYTIRLDYAFSRSVNVYATYATGFKASSINLSRDSRPFLYDKTAIINAGLAVPNLTYGSRYASPEHSSVMEVGIKTNFKHISVNLDVFKQAIRGFQSNIFTGTGFALLNAGKQSTWGVEAESTFNYGGLTLNAAATYLDPKYDSFEFSSVGNLTGTRPAGIPSWSLVGGVQYEFRVGTSKIVPRVTYSWESRYQLVEGLPGFLVRGPDGSIINSAPAIAAAKPFTAQPTNLTASLTWQCACGLQVQAWGRNLTNHQDLGVIFDSPAQPGGISGYPSDPRTYGVTLRYKF